jgi:hypothetical protein
MGGEVLAYFMSILQRPFAGTEEATETLSHVVEFRATTTTESLLFSVYFLPFIPYTLSIDHELFLARFKDYEGTSFQ